MSESGTRRWMIYRPGNYEVPGTGEVWESATHVDPELDPGDEIEVIPVAEHEELMRNLRGELALKEEALSVVVPGRDRYRQALVDIAGWENWQRPSWRDIAREALDA